MNIYDQYLTTHIKTPWLVSNGFGSNSNNVPKTLWIHCSATPDDRPTSAVEIDQWHKGKGWRGIGYHFVIRRDGSVEPGRDPKLTGAHTLGHNLNSLGICMEGGIADFGETDAFYPDVQWEALAELVTVLQEHHDIPDDAVRGHNEVSSKSCPSFAVDDWLESLDVDRWLLLREVEEPEHTGTLGYLEGYATGLKQGRADAFEQVQDALAALTK